MFQGPPGAPQSWRPRVNPTAQTHTDQRAQDRVPSRIVPLPSSHQEKSARKVEGRWCFCKILFVSHMWICFFCFFLWNLCFYFDKWVVPHGWGQCPDLPAPQFFSPRKKCLLAEHQSEIIDSELEQQVRMKFQLVRPGGPRRPLLAELELDTSVPQLLLVVPDMPSSRHLLAPGGHTTAISTQHFYTLHFHSGPSILASL